MQIKTLKLPQELRSELAKPMGELLKGSAEANAPRIEQFLKKHSIRYAVAIGDVVSEALVNHGFFPQVLVTDGQTKRQSIGYDLEFPGYELVRVASPPAVISAEAWLAIRQLCRVLETETRVHLVVDGEEDLLALPFILELPLNSAVIYGQPNEGAVVIPVTQSKKFLIENLMEKMES
ncbi:MAG: DUF359 domain-containing protein [Methanobacteriota archaeon]|nr:MAG: DUF359 domain-containing protein [Euryarchaeota archaeon]